MKCFYFFLLLLQIFFSHWSIWQPLEPYGKKLWNLFHVSHGGTLAPPTGQSWTCVYMRNLWTVWPICKNEVPLDSLDEDKFNTPYDPDFKKTVHSSPELAQIIVRATLTQIIKGFFIFKTVCPVQTIKIGSWVISQQIFKISTPNLVWAFWGCPNNLMSCDHWEWPLEAKMHFGQ